MTLAALLNLTRLHTAGWEAFVFVLGPLLVGVGPGDRTVLLLWASGIVVNAFIFTLNDLADLPRDRLDPRRQQSPLVSGEVSSAFALFLSCALPIALWLAIALDDWTAAAEASFAALLLLGTYLDMYQKTSPRVHPFALDILFAVCMAGPVPVGIAAVHRSVPAHAWAVTGALFLLFVGLNAVGGNLKDLPSDARTGFLTTALRLGVRSDGERLVFSPAYRRFLYAIGALPVPFVAWVAVLARGQHGIVVDVAAAVVVTALLAAVQRDVHRLATGRRAPAARGREPFFALGVAAVVVVALLHAHVVGLLGALGVAAAWEVGLRVSWRSMRRQSIV